MRWWCPKAISFPKSGCVTECCNNSDFDQRFLPVGMSRAGESTKKTEEKDQGVD